MESHVLSACIQIGNDGFKLIQAFKKSMRLLCLLLRILIGVFSFLVWLNFGWLTLLIVNAMKKCKDTQTNDRIKQELCFHICICHCDNTVNGSVLNKLVTI